MNIKDLYIKNFIINYEEVLPIVQKMQAALPKDFLGKAGVSKKYLEHDNCLELDRIRYFEPKRKNVVSNNIKKLMPYLNEGKMRILDVGCGYGDYMAVLRALGHEVYGINSSFISEDFAYSTNKLGLNVLSHDLPSSIPFADNFFDVVLCIGVVTLKCFENNIKDVIQELNRVSGKYVSIKCHEKMYDFYKINSAQDLINSEWSTVDSSKDYVVWKTF